MTPRSKKLPALVTYGISLYPRATSESRAQDLSVSPSFGALPDVVGGAEPAKRAR